MIKRAIAIVIDKTLAQSCYYSAWGLANRWRRGRRRRFTVDRIRLHQLASSAIRVIEIQLPFAVDPRANLEGPRVAFAGGTSLKIGERLRQIGHLKADMVQRPERFQVRLLVIEHELDVVRAVGHAHVDPAKRLAILASAPELSKAQNLTIEFQSRFKPTHNDSKVSHVSRYARAIKSLPLIANSPAIGLILNDLDRVAIRVRDV